MSAGRERLRHSRPALRLVEHQDAAPRGEKRGTKRPRADRRVRRPGAIPGVTIALVLMIALAVTLQAQRVAGQDSLESVRAEVRDAGRMQAELRATVAEAEAPAQILRAAGQLGMIEPAAVVAVPAAAPTPRSDDLADRG